MPTLLLRRSPRLVVAAALSACSSDDGGSPSTLTVAKSATNSGDAQTGTGRAGHWPTRFASSVTDGGVAAEWRDGDVGHDQRRQPRARDEHHRRERNRGDDVDPRWRRRCPDGDGVRHGREWLARHLHGDVDRSCPTITVGPGGALQFSPATITINAGQSVRFVWATGATTTMWSPKRQPHADPAKPGPHRVRSRRSSSAPSSRAPATSSSSAPCTGDNPAARRRSGHVVAPSPSTDAAHN